MEIFRTVFLFFSSNLRIYQHAICQLVRFYLLLVITICALEGLAFFHLRTDLYFITCNMWVAQQWSVLSSEMQTMDRRMLTN